MRPPVPPPRRPRPGPSELRARAPGPRERPGADVRGGSVEHGPSWQGEGSAGCPAGSEDAPLRGCSRHRRPGEGGIASGQRSQPGPLLKASGSRVETAAFIRLLGPPDFLLVDRALGARSARGTWRQRPGWLCAGGELASEAPLAGGAARRECRCISFVALPVATPRGAVLWSRGLQGRGLTGSHWRPSLRVWSAAP